MKKRKSGEEKTGRAREDELARLREEHERLLATNNVLNERVLELYTLYNVSRTLSMSLQVTELFDLVMNVIVNSLGVRQYSLMLVDEGTDMLMIRASHGMPAEILSRGFGPSSATGCAARWRGRRRPCFVRT
ncbi:MAG: hypothetical protein MZU91_06425 [Desulfosudis oleivorans]|nr:hypothetical protein [Desulfosudis oleivorans]